jgi:hypothetical protein
MIQKGCGSVFFLAEKEQMLGVILTARAVLEGTINALYILAVGSDASEKAMRHALQKSYRDMTHINRFYQLYLEDKADVFADIEPSDSIQEALDEFSTKHGKELPYWTPKSLHDRIEVVDKVFGTQPAAMLRIATSAIFRHSSEVLHGTLYGALYALHQVPIPQDAKSPADLEVKNRQSISTMCLLIICLIDQLVIALSNEIDDASFVRKSRDTVESIRDCVSFEE